MNYVIYFIIYLIVYILSFIFMDKFHQKIYIYTILNLDHIIHSMKHIFPIYQVTLPIIILTFPLLYQICLFIKCEFLFHPIWAKSSRLISLMINKELVENMSSKIWWYNIFTENNIETPIVYYHFINGKKIVINEINQFEIDMNKEFVIKPTFGSGGKGIKKINLDEINNIKGDNIIQEYIHDCNSINDIHFKIITLYPFWIKREPYLFFILKREKNETILKECNKKCNDLTINEQMYIDQITYKLLKLHKKFEFPTMAWDICLTCNGAYVFEGAYGPGPGFVNKDYVDFMKDAYKNINI